jgi:hypothetical protein
MPEGNRGRTEEDAEGMSHTFYDSPEDAPHPHISIDVTHDFVWFFQETEPDGRDANQMYCRVRREDLPAIYRAMGEFLKDE